jgi:hypothetical protein
MRDVWGHSTRRTGEYFVFHDESVPNKRWLLIGLLFVQSLQLDNVRAVLQQVRAREGYHGEIHFAALPKSFGGSWGAKARVARESLQCLHNGLHDRVVFSVLVVDRKSPRYEQQALYQRLPRV